MVELIQFLTWDQRKCNKICGIFSGMHLTDKTILHFECYKPETMSEMRIRSMKCKPSSTVFGVLSLLSSVLVILKALAFVSFSGSVIFKHNLIGGAVDLHSNLRAICKSSLIIWEHIEFLFFFFNFNLILFLCLSFLYSLLLSSQHILVGFWVSVSALFHCLFHPVQLELWHHI